MDNEDKKIDGSENKEQIAIISADLLNPFKTTSIETKKEEQKEVKEEVKKEIKEEPKTIINSNNNIIDNSNINEKPIISNSKEFKDNNVKNDDNDFYSNFSYENSSENVIKNNNVNNNTIIENVNTNNLSFNNNISSDLPDRKSSVPIIVIAFIGFGLQFLNGYYLIAGFALCILSIIFSIIMYRKLAKYALLSIIISVILSIASVILYFLSFNAVDDMVKQSKETIFKNSAISFINGAYMNAISNNKISCADNTSVKYYLSELEENIGGTYDRENSYVLIEAFMENDACIYRKYIYLTDGNYTLGTIDNPIEENNISSTNIN